MPQSEALWFWEDPKPVGFRVIFVEAHGYFLELWDGRPFPSFMLLP